MHLELIIRSFGGILAPLNSLLWLYNSGKSEVFARESSIAAFFSAFEKPIKIDNFEGDFQSFAYKFHEADGLRDVAIGFYFNMFYQTGPEKESFAADRGDVGLSANFLLRHKHFAIGISPEVFERMSKDQYYQAAVPLDKKKPEKGYKYPVKDGKETLGELENIQIGPELEWNLKEQIYEPTGSINIFSSVQAT